MRDYNKTKELLAQVPNLPQRQDSFSDQMADLYDVANRLGLCDAADGLVACWGNFSEPKSPSFTRKES